MDAVAPSGMLACAGDAYVIVAVVVVMVRGEGRGRDGERGGTVTELAGDGSSLRSRTEGESASRACLPGKSACPGNECLEVAH